MNIYEIPIKSTFGCYSDMTGIDFLVMVYAGDFELAKQIAKTELEKWSVGEPDEYVNIGYIECVSNAFEKARISATFYDIVKGE